MLEINGSYISADISEIISELKSELEISGVHLFYKSTDTPNNYMVCCPFHKEGQEKKPSMGILKSDGTCHCFACGWVGSLSEMISHCFGYDDLGAFGSKWLIKNFLTLQIEDRGDIELDFERKSTNPINQFVSEEELDKYRYNHPYWAKRRITDEKLIELFDLGFDPGTNCITFPIRDVKGNCIFVARRSVQTKYFNYPAGVSKPLYGLYEYLTDVQKSVDKLRTQRSGKTCYLEKANEVIVCESMIDALTCWQYGKYAVALNGLGNELQFQQLREMPCRKLILATDNDNAGMQARQRIANNVTNKIITQYIGFKNKKDINELSKEEFDDLEEIFI